MDGSGDFKMYRPVGMSEPIVKVFNPGLWGQRNNALPCTEFKIQALWFSVLIRMLGKKRTSPAFIGLG
jgi:hypothetical protein